MKRHSTLSLLPIGLFCLAGLPAWAQQDWVPKVVPPPARAGAAAAYDSVHGQLVMFGGTFPGGAFTNETWLFDGWKWSSVTPAHAPTARTGAGIIFDPVLQQVLLFGGSINASTGNNETWVWDGSDWSELSPANTPSAMKSPLLAADTTRSRGVLFGNGETWEWDGTNWTQKNPASVPSARTGSAMAYDAQRGYTVMFGGLVGTTYPTDTWLWDGVNWTLMNMSGPSGRAYASMTYDAEHRQVVIFGGGQPASSGTYTYNDSWAWDGLKWNQLSGNTYTSDATHPLYRGGAVMVYHPLRRATVLYGGSRSGVPGTTNAGLDDTWSWDGSAWSALTPVNRAAARMVWDSSRHHVVMFGGFVANWSYNYNGDSFDGRDTWVWDGATWANQNSAHRPPARRDFAMAYDAAHDRVLIFGGASEGYGHATADMNDMWAWDGSDWTQLTPAVLPSARHACRMAYDAANQRVVLYGGYAMNDTWVWDGANWTQLSPATSPPTLSAFELAYDPARSRVMWAGFTYSYSLDATNNWTPQAASSYIPTGGEMVWDAALNKMLIYDGHSLLAYDGTSWAALTTATTLPDHPNTAMVYDDVRNQVVLNGGGTYGSSYYSTVGDTWVLTAAETTGSIYVQTNLPGAFYSIAGPTPESGSGASSSWSGAAPGSYTITYGTVAGYSTPDPETRTLAAGSSIGFTGGYGVLPGSISVTSNVSAGFTLTGTYGYSGSGTPLTLTNVPAGTYTIHWLPIAGYTTPAIQTQTLAIGGSIAFGATYTLLPTTCTLTVGTNVAGATFSVIGPASYYGSGTSYSQSGIPPGTYTITYDPVVLYLTPPSETKTVASGETLVFTGTYTLGTPAVNVGWVLKTPAPSGRANFSAVYDAARRQVVMFGGTRGFDINETWVFDGTAWNRRHPVHSPPAQQLAPMVYDPVNQVAVLSGAAGSVRDTWTWDGNDWTQLSPANTPSIEYPGNLDYPAMAYDAARAQTVRINNYCTETWTWDGSNWTQKAAVPIPKDSAWGCYAGYDAARSEVVLVAKYESSGACCTDYDTWTWDGTAWTQKATVTMGDYYTAPTTVPVPAPLTYDPVRQQIVLADPKGVTWVWNGAAWTKETPANSPSARTNPGLVFDPVSSHVLMLAGLETATGNYIELTNDIWTWDGSNWTQQATSPSNPVRNGTAMVYDPARGETVLFGGATLTGWPTDTWIWDGNVWTQRVTAHSPHMRADLQLVYDAARQQVVLFGGDGQYVYLCDTWVFDGVDWTQKSPATIPSNRRGNMMAYDAAHGVVVMFGGLGYSGALNDTWTWDGSNWTQKSPATSPPARQLGSMSYDPVRGKVLLFGGQDASQVKFGDTWEWDGTNWTQLSPATSPSARDVGAMAFDTLRGYMLLYGGVTSNYCCVFDASTWSWDGTNWTQQSSADSPPAVAAAMTYDAARGKITTFGAWTLPHYFAEDVWLWDEVPVPPTTGTIFVNTNLAAATFTLSGTASYSGSGTSWSQGSAPAGSYTITYNAVAGYTAPAVQTQTLAAGGTVTFTGTYVPTATHFGVSAPVSATAGSSFSFTVTAQDASNNTVTGYAGTVHFTSSDPQAVLPANATLTSGVGTFSAMLKTTGNQTLTATDTVTSSVTGSSGTIAVGASAAVLSIAKSHTANFTQGQQNATYTVVVSNGAGAGSTSGTVTVTETAPSGLTLVSMAGTGWTCASNSCTRSDALAAGASYPAITVTVNVGINATSPQVNQVSVTWGGTGSASATDSTVILNQANEAAIPTLAGWGRLFFAVELGLLAVWVLRRRS